jgi:hypothetical protein
MALYLNTGFSVLSCWRMGDCKITRAVYERSQILYSNELLADRCGSLLYVSKLAFGLRNIHHPVDAEFIFEPTKRVAPRFFFEWLLYVPAFA